jgi:hypothetical protein
MKTDEIKAKSSELAALYTAKANGKTLQYDVERRGFLDHPDDDGPSMACNLSRWRVKPEPRRFWIWINQGGEVVDSTRHPERAEKWRTAGHVVIETVEVLP